MKRCSEAVLRVVFGRCALTALGLACWGMVASARAEDLMDSYAQARAADPVLATADAQRGVQRELATQARAALLPQWQLFATDTRTQREQSRISQVGSSITQVLLDLGRLRSWQAESTQASAQDARVMAAEQDLCARVARAYFGVLSAQAALASTQANEDTYALQAGQAQKRFEAGLSAQVDVEQARAYYELSRGGTVQARQALADAREALAQITGQRPGPLKVLATSLPAVAPQPQEPQAWVDQALRANPLLQAQALGLNASRQRVEAARAAYWPTLQLGVDSVRNAGPGVVDIDRGRSLTQIGLRLNVPLFAGGATQSQVRQAAYQRDAVQQDLETTRRAVTRETLAQYQAVLAGMALMESTQAALAAAERALASTRTGQSLGTRTLTDLLLAIQTRTSAQNAFDQARHGYVLSRLLLQQAAGDLGEAQLASVNQLLQ